MRVVALLFAIALASDRANPIGRVVQLITGLKTKIEQEGRNEQAVYDKYACWCEETTARKAAAIEAGKTRIAELSQSILKLNGNSGSAGAEIKKLKKDIKETEETMTKMTEVRNKQNKDHVAQKAALEQGIDNLGKAIKTLFAGTRDFEPSMVETRMLTIAAGVRSAMDLYTRTNTDVDMSPVKSFLANPVALIGTKTPSHLQKYNTQSTVIQGMLDQMLEDFHNQLDEAVATEKQQKEDFDALMATKHEDMNLLQATLTAREVQHADDQQQLAEESQEREQTQKQLKADEAFFETTKDECKVKADEWSERVRLRTEELHGIEQAVSILSSDDAKATFSASESTFVQTFSTVTGPKRTQAFNILKEVATQTGSMSLAAIASTVYTSGHFDAVIADIDAMIANLRKEEAADVEHKDWCETEKANSDSRNENLEYQKEELTKKAGRAEAKKKELEMEQAATRQDKLNLEKAMQEALENRNNEHADFQQALKDDTDAVMLIAKAVEAMSAFYKNNGLAFAQVRKAGQPEYAEDKDVAPESFSSEYGGRKSENTGVTAILEMIKEDIQKEIKVARQEEADSAAAYAELTKDNRASSKALKEKDVSLGQAIADKMKLISTTNGAADDTQSSMDSTDEYLGDLGPNCEWVDTNFDSRREKRKAEVDGLENAKNVLAGAGAGEAPSAGMRLTAVGATVSSSPDVSIDDEMSALDAAEQSINFLQRK